MRKGSPLPVNPETKKPIILVPKRWLRFVLAPDRSNQAHNTKPRLAAGLDYS